jgi:hypothetical protein
VLIKGFLLLQVPLPSIAVACFWRLLVATPWQ